MKCYNCSNDETETGTMLKRCSACKSYYYCSVDCQHNDYPKHRSECKRLTNAMRKADESGNVQLLALTRDEREREFKRICDFDPVIEDLAEYTGDGYEGYDLDPPPSLVTQKQPKYMWEDYDTVEEALEDFDWEGNSTPEELEAERADLEEELYWWEYEERYPSLEAACMDCYKAKSVEEAVWDSVSIPRIRVIFPDGTAREDQGRMMQRAGWKYVGYEPGDICMNETTMIRGQRVVGGYGDGWEEGSHR